MAEQLVSSCATKYSDGIITCGTRLLGVIIGTDDDGRVIVSMTAGNSKSGISALVKHPGRWEFVAAPETWWWE